MRRGEPVSFIGSDQENQPADEHLGPGGQGSILT